MKLFLFALFAIFLSFNTMAQTIRFAVGPDHESMMNNNYAVYRANWEFLAESLKRLDIELIPVPMPWARAKALVKDGTHHGLFLAANFEERNQWAEFSSPLAYEVFGSFVHKDNPKANNVIAAVRLGGNDKILSYLQPDTLLNVATAQRGLALLHNKRVDRFIMARGYGEYLLKNELKVAKDIITFDMDGAELRSMHVAFANNNSESLAMLLIVNRAIKLGMEKGIYYQIMSKYQVPKDMLVSSKQSIK